MRVLVLGRQKMACTFDARVSGLNGLLGRREIGTNKSVDVFRVDSLSWYLCETGLCHFMLLICENVDAASCTTYKTYRQIGSLSA